MAGSASDYAENKLLELIVGKTGFTTPTVYVALCTAAVTDSSTGSTITEANYTGYARKSTAGADWGTASGGSITNANAITFAACTAGSSTITYFALVDSSGTGTGNVLAYGDLSSSVTISTTVTPAQFAAGTLAITCT